LWNGEYIVTGALKIYDFFYLNFENVDAKANRYCYGMVIW
jgi:hypothetical protein